jgi:hypothetical protein
MKAQTGFLIAIVLIAAGCNLNPNSVAEVSSATTAASSTEDASDASVPMTTQVDTRSGVAFDYPTGWTVVPPPDAPAVAYSYSIASFDLLNPPFTPSKSQQGVPAGETEIQVNFHAADETVESIRSNLQADVANGTAKILKEEPRTGPNGAKAYYYEIQGMFEGTGYLLQTSLNGHTVSVVAYGEGAHFEDVIKSLRVA